MADNKGVADPGRILLRYEDDIAVITLDRPSMRNAMSTEMWRSLEGIAKELHDRTDIGAVIIHGAGDTFSAGLDLQEMHRITLPEVEEAFKAMERAIGAVENLPMPTVGALRGVATGGGCELLLACDVRVGSRTARMGMPIARLGITIGADFGQRLTRLMGPSIARDLLYTGRLLSGIQAYRWGLINYMVRDEEVMDRVWALARRIAAQSPASNRASKAATDPGLMLQGPNAFAGQVHRYAADPDDFREGIRAWVEKREPVFRKRGS